MSASSSVCSGSNGKTRILARVNSREPAKINRLIKNGYKKEKPFEESKNPYDIPRKRKPVKIGSVCGNAALIAFICKLLLTL